MTRELEWRARRRPHKSTCRCGAPTAVSSNQIGFLRRLSPRNQILGPGFGEGRGRVRDRHGARAPVSHFGRRSELERRLAQQLGPLHLVARIAASDHVLPAGRTATRSRVHVVQGRRGRAAILTGCAVAVEYAGPSRVGRFHLPSRLPVLGQDDDRRQSQREVLRVHLHGGRLQCGRHVLFAEPQAAQRICRGERAKVGVEDQSAYSRRVSAHFPNVSSMIVDRRNLTQRVCLGEDARARRAMYVGRRDAALPRGQSTRRARIEGSRI